MKRIFLLLSLTFFGLLVIAQGILQNPKPSNNYLAAVHFIDANTGFTVGEFGTILKTTDGGTTWSLLTSGTTSSLYSIDFVNSNVGYVVGSGGMILKTTNGGVSWQKLSSGIYTELSTLSFTDEAIGFVGGKNGILKTVDGGATWTNVSFGKVKSIDFVDKDKGFALFYEGMFDDLYLYKTINGGTTWLKLPISTGYPLYDIFFCTTSTGYYTAGNGTFKTSNGGMSWVNVNNHSGLPFFINENIGYVLPNQKTIDGGLTWQTFTEPIPNGSKNSLYFTDVNTGYIAVDDYPKGSVIMKTIDGGKSWTKLSNQLFNDLFAVHFPTKSVGYAVGYIGTILKTSDGGLNWNKLSINTKEQFNSVYFTDNLTGYVVGSSDTIFQTTNGGSSWIPTKLKDVYNLNSVFLINKDIGFVVGGNSIFKTTDGGKNWVDLSFSNDYSLESVYFNDQNTGYVIGNDYYNGSMIMKTSDGGKSWDFVWTSNDNSNEYGLKSIRFINDNVGYVSATCNSYWYGHDVGYLKTTNGGSTWIYDRVFGGTYLGNFYFTDINTGYYVGEYGNYFKTTDGGLKWTSLITCTSSDLTNVFFTDANTGYAVGLSGVIVKITDGFPLGIEESISQLSQFEMYPNPAKDVFTISNIVPISGDIMVSIFSINGKQIMQDKFQNQNKIEIDISTFIKGIYLVKIQSKERIETRKLVIQ